MSDAEESRAAKLHREAIVIDLLSQRAGARIFDHYPSGLRADLDARINASNNIYERYSIAVNWPYDMALSGQSGLIYDWYREAGLSIISHQLPIFEDPLQGIDATPYLDGNRMRLVTTAAEMRAAKADNVIGSFANYQPLVSIPNDLSAITRAFEKGLRSLMLTYNSMTSVGSGCTERADAGLSHHGVRVVKHCNELGVIVDTSHCGPQTTLDACRFSKKPVTANHTSAKGLFSHSRGKDDDCLKAIAGTGGLIGVLAVPAYLTDSNKPSIEHMLDHIEYIAGLVGWQHVAIGTDWPLQAPIEIQRPLFSPSNADTGFRAEDALDVEVNLDGFDDCRDMPNITRGLVSRGWSDEAVIAVLGENALRVFAAVCG